MNLFGGLQKDSADQLAAAPFFSGVGYLPAVKPIPVVYEQLFDIQNQINLALGSLGIITTLLTVSGRDSNPNRRKPYFEDIRIVARTQENVKLNRAPGGSGQSASVVALASALILHGWTPAGLGAALFCTDVLLVANTKLFVWDAIFKCQAGMTEDAPIRCPWPPPAGSPTTNALL